MFYLLTNCSPRNTHFSARLVSVYFSTDSNWIAFNSCSNVISFKLLHYLTTTTNQVILTTIYYTLVPIVSGVLFWFISFYFYSVSCLWSSVVINGVQLARIDLFEDCENSISYSIRRGKIGTHSVSNLKIAILIWDFSINRTQNKLRIYTHQSPDAATFRKNVLCRFILSLRIDHRGWRTNYLNYYYFQ